MDAPKHPLAIWREAQDPPLTQGAFAERVGTSRWAITRIETGNLQPGRKLILAIAKETNGAVGFEQLAEVAA